MSEHWYACRRVKRPGPRGGRERWCYVKAAGQEPHGYAKVSGVIEFLLAAGHIERVHDPEEGDWLKGWGGHDGWYAVAPDHENIVEAPVEQGSLL